MASTATTSAPHLTTFAQYQRAVEVVLRQRPGLRKGQAFFNVLLELEPDVAHGLTGTAEDPFYDDGKLPEFLVRVVEELG
jgi:hypothetical protein